MITPIEGISDKLQQARKRLRDEMDEMDFVLNDPAGSSWIKYALTTAMMRDPVDAADDAECLSNLLSDVRDAHSEVAQLETLKIRSNTQ